MDSPCPPEDDLLAFSSGQVSDVQRKTLLGHLAQCDECRAVTSELSKERIGLAATATPAPAPEPPRVARRGPTAFAPGEIVAGKFRVLKVLGAGGMGFVLEAEHLLLEQRVALKFMGRELVEDAEATRRFLREARAAARIPSEHVVKVLDVATLDDGAPYIVMERLEGADLAKVLEREGRLEQERAVGYVLEAMEVLAHAHAKGIVHRDLKPANLFLAEREDGSRMVKVLDFGIAKAQEHVGGGGVTTSRTVLGSPRYMAPEQMQSAKDVDARADVWALGTILFELVSGRPAFDGETFAALSVAICAGQKPSLSDVLPSASPALVEAVGACLERSRDARIRDVASLARVLAPLGPPSAFVSLERIVAALPAEGGVLVEAPSRGSVAVSVRDAPPASSTAKWVAFAALVSGIVVLASGIYVGLARRPTDPAPSSVRAEVVAPGLAPSSSPSLPALPIEPSALPSAAPSTRSIGVPMPLDGAPKKAASPAHRPEPAPSAPAAAPPKPALPPPSATPYDERK